MLRHGLFIVFLLTLVTACASPDAGTALPTGSASEITQAPALPSEPVPTQAPVPSDTPAAGQVPGQGATDSPSPAPFAASAAGTIDLAAIQLDLQPVVTGLSFPVGIASAGDGSGRLFVLEKNGVIRVVRDGMLLDMPFLVLTDRVGSRSSEQGLLGLAFHPDFDRNGQYFVYYTDTNGDTVVSRFSSVDADIGDADSEAVLLRVDQPAPNHNGGQLAFGPDGYLYIGLGDGGGGGDSHGNSQKPDTLLAKLLRIDVDGGDPYAIPPGNPFVNQRGTRPEIWATGLRNPWRFSFDRTTGDLYIGDVGQGDYEEVDFQPAASKGGENYGWVIMEGTHCFRQQECDQTGLTLPVAEYDHSQGCSLTGGYVYRGQQYPQLSGVYIFGDYCSGRIWGLARDAGGIWQMAELGQFDVRLTSFGQDDAGELYLADGGGALFRIAVKAVTGN